MTRPPPKSPLFPYPPLSRSPYVCIPTQPNSFAGTGFLGSAYGPFSLGAAPANGSFKVRDLNLPGGVDEKRFAARRDIRAVVDERSEEHTSELQSPCNLVCRL